MARKDRVLEGEGLDLDPRTDAGVRTSAATNEGEQDEQQAIAGPSAVSPPSPSTGIVIEPLVRGSGGGPTRRRRAARTPEEHPAPDA
jgi:hypothetical protein